jgi:hypothetical protein
MIWFLSFADGSPPKGTQFLGGCVVEADHFMTAVQVAHLKGCNPGGEVQGRELGNLKEVVEETAAFHNRLLTHAECDAFFEAFFAACEAHAAVKGRA